MMNFLASLLLLIAIGLPLVIGIRCLLPRATPVSQAAGLLTLFPLVNAPLSFFGSMATPSLNDGYPETGLIPGIVMGVLLLGWLYEDWLKGQLRRWLWVSAGLATVHWLIMPVIWWLLGYGVWYFYDDLQGNNPPLAPSYSVPALLIFALLPALAALFIHPLDAPPRRPSPFIHLNLHHSVSSSPFCELSTVYSPPSP